MEDLAIIKSLMDGNHLSDKELIRATELIKLLKISIMRRIK